MKSYTKLDILYLVSQMKDILGDIDNIVNAIDRKQITKKEVKKSLKSLSKQHDIKVCKVVNALNSYFSDSSY